MTRALLSTVATALLLAAGCTPAPETVADQSRTAAPAIAATAGEEGISQDQADIERLEREWVAAIANKNTVGLERLLADDFVGTSPSAHTYDRRMALSDLTSGTYVVTSMELDEVSANIYGNTAVAFTSQEEVSTYGGKSTSGHYHYTNVWIRNNGTWRVVASHGSRYEGRH